MQVRLSVCSASAWQVFGRSDFKLQTSDFELNPQLRGLRGARPQGGGRTRVAVHVLRLDSSRRSRRRRTCSAWRRKRCAAAKLSFGVGELLQVPDAKRIAQKDVDR